MRLGWSHIKDERIQTLDDHAFEAFCRDLLDAERAERAAPRASDIEGPAPNKSADGGVDVRVTFVRALAETAKDWCHRVGARRSLLGDPNAGTQLVVSCKTGKTWESGALRDAKDGGERVVPVLLGGGRLLVVTSAFCPSSPSEKKRASRKATTDAVSEKAAVRRRLAELYAARPALAGRGVDALLEQIDVWDGRDIADYLRSARPMLHRGQWAQVFDLHEYPALRSYEDWKTSRAQREHVLWQNDEERASSLSALTAFASESSAVPADDAVLCVMGPPGIGKTRFVQHAVEQSGRTAAALYSTNPARVREHLEGHLLEDLPGGLFVVDDCSVHEVSVLRTAFRESAEGETRARLILICPSAPGRSSDLDGCRTITLPKLSRSASWHIIQVVLGQSEDRDVERVHELTQGYPWFAILVAREMKRGAVLPSSTTQAARTAIAGDATEDQRSRVSAQRARALLAVMLTPDTRWRSIDDEELDRLANAVELTHRDTLREVLKDCIDRGLVRETERYYVTPYVLEREVWNILDDGGPGHPLARRIARHLPERAAKLFERLGEVGVAPERIARVAISLLGEMFSADATAESLERSPLTAALKRCAEHAPAETLEAVSSLVARTTVEELRTRTRLRRPLLGAVTGALPHGQLFDHVEATLFRLMLAENESFVDAASVMWAWLFLPWIEIPGTSFSHKFRALEHRCRKGAQHERLAAVEALPGIASGTLGVVGSAWVALRDATKTFERARDDYAPLWALLLRCAGDENADVARAAQHGIAGGLAHAIRHGMLHGLEAELSAVLRALPEDLRLVVRTEVERPRSDAEDTQRLWDVVDAATRGLSYRQRVWDALSSPWAHTPSDRDVEAARDKALIEEGLRAPEHPLREMLSEVSGARRAAPFLIRVGEVDEHALLRDDLVTLARDATTDTALAFYCVGHHLAGRDAALRAWWLSWRDDASLRRAVVETLVRVGPDDEGMAWLEGLVRTGTMPLDLVSTLALGRWERTSPEARGRMYRALALHPESAAAQVILNRLADVSEPLSRDECDALEDAICTVAPRVAAGENPWYFSRAAERLLALGRVRATARAALRAITQSDYPDAPLWVLLEQCAARSPDALWPGLTEILGARVWRRALRWYRVVEVLQTEPVMEWVGHQSARGEAVAESLRMVGEDIPPIASALVERFGAGSSSADALIENLLAAPDAVRDFESFHERQRGLLTRAHDHPSRELQAWIARALGALARAGRTLGEPRPLHRRTG